MRARSGFTIVDLVISIAATSAAVIVLCALPMACSRNSDNSTPAAGTDAEAAKAPDHRAACANNLKAIHKAFMMYCNENGDKWPWMAGKDWDTTPTGTNRTEAPSPDVARCVTALPHMLVKATSQPANLFVCPGDKQAAADTGGNDAWDFSSAKNISYSYASPVVMSGSAWPGIVNGKSDQNLVVMADKTPACDGGKADTDWSKTLSDSDKAAGMSKNHADQKSFNVLFIDGHVATFQSPLLHDDNIYSASGNDRVSASGMVGMNNHVSFRESYVIGPIGK